MRVGRNAECNVGRVTYIVTMFILQRVSCCLCLLYTSMLANALFYGTAGQSQTTFTIGPFALTPEQVSRQRSVGAMVTVVFRTEYNVTNDISVNCFVRNQQ